MTSTVGLSDIEMGDIGGAAKIERAVVVHRGKLCGFEVVDCSQRLSITCMTTAACATVILVVIAVVSFIFASGAVYQPGIGIGCAILAVGCCLNAIVHKVSTDRIGKFKPQKQLEDDVDAFGKDVMAAGGATGDAGKNAQNLEEEEQKLAADTAGQNKVVINLKQAFESKVQELNLVQQKLQATEAALSQLKNLYEQLRAKNLETCKFVKQLSDADATFGAKLKELGFEEEELKKTEAIWDQNYTKITTETQVMENYTERLEAVSKGLQDQVAQDMKFYDLVSKLAAKVVEDGKKLEEAGQKLLDGQKKLESVVLEKEKILKEFDDKITKQKEELVKIRQALVKMPNAADFKEVIAIIDSITK